MHEQRMFEAAICTSCNLVCLSSMLRLQVLSRQDERRALPATQVWLDTKFAGVNYNNSEQFNTAGRSIGTGLMAIDLVSHWTWASVL